MTSIVPDLDITTFEQLVERARGQIPRLRPRAGPTTTSTTRA